MLVETAQILCSAYYFTNQEYLSQYKLTHKNHPCCKWARESLDNWLWLHELGIQLHEEFKYRFGKEHKSGAVIESLLVPNLKCNGFSEPPVVFGKYKALSRFYFTTKTLYKNIYICKYYDWKETSKEMKWTNREMSKFIKKVLK